MKISLQEKYYLDDRCLHLSKDLQRKTDQIVLLEREVKELRDKNKAQTQAIEQEKESLLSKLQMTQQLLKNEKLE